MLRKHENDTQRIYQIYISQGAFYWQLEKKIAIKDMQKMHLEDYCIFKKINKSHKI